MRAQIRPLKESVDAITTMVAPTMDFDTRIFTDQAHWTLREALIFSYHWSFSTLSASDFVRFKQDCHIADVLSSPTETLFVQQQEAKQFLGQWTFS